MVHVFRDLILYGMLALLSKLKLSHFLALGVLLLALGFMHYKGKYEAEKVTSEIKDSNYNEVLKLTKQNDSMQIVNLKFQNNQEVESYINHNETLKNLLAKQGFESSRDYKKLENIHLSSITYYDSVLTTLNANKILDNIKNNEDGILPFHNKGKCIETKGNFEYKDGNLNYNLTSQEFKGNILVTRSEGKRTKGFPSKKFALFRYGKKEVVNKATTDCGDVKVQVIEKVE